MGTLEQPLGGTMTSYSQYGEDLRAWEICGRRGLRNGRMLEIGAWHPIDKSNSRLFIEAGWDAVLIEPSPAGIVALAKEYNDHPRVNVCAYPLTVHGGTVRMHLSDDALTGETIPEQWKEAGGFYGCVDMMSMSLEAFFHQYGGDFQVCSIDVEGLSVDLFCEMMRIGPRPRVVIVEHDNRHVELMGMAQAAGYQQTWLNGTNTVLEWRG